MNRILLGEWKKSHEGTIFVEFDKSFLCVRCMLHAFFAVRIILLDPSPRPGILVPVFCNHSARGSATPVKRAEILLHS